MNIEYSYGVFGYFMKYLGGVGLTLMAALFLFILFSVILTGYYSEKPFESLLLTSMSMLMIWFCLIGSFYCFRYRNLFTKRFVFNKKGILISEGDETQAICAGSIREIIYRKMLKVFEIKFENSGIQRVIIMNNGQKETSSFIQVKEYLLGYPHVIVRWW